jgi:hypothetical protein
VRKTGLRLMVPNSIALPIRTGSRPVIPEKLAQITKRPVAPVKMHTWDAPNWMLVARRHLAGGGEPENWPSAGALTEGERPSRHTSQRIAPSTSIRFPIAAAGCQQTPRNSNSF